MAGVGEFYYELRVARRGDAAADEATLRRVTFIKKLRERAYFSGSCWSACRRARMRWTAPWGG